MNKIEQYLTKDLPIKNELLHFLKNIKQIIIFDIGACECEDSIRYSRLFKDATIFSFEPHPGNYKKCLLNLKAHDSKNIQVFQLALGAKKDKVKFYVSSGNPDGCDPNEWDYGNKSSSIYKPNNDLNKFKWLRFDNEIMVDISTIESFCNEQNIERVDFLHIDVQGAELDVLKGANNYLSKVRMIWLEVENIPLYQEQPLRNDIEVFLKSTGFFKIKDTAFGDSGDQLYVNLRFYSLLDFFLLKCYIISKLKRLKFFIKKSIKL